MYIKNIKLNNFRIYKGANSINLLPSGNSNIIVISGKNGFGKTTFLMALVWCLYGKRMRKVDEMYKTEIDNKGNYTKYISESLNRQAREEGETEFSVSITFSDVRIPDITCSEVTITRSYDTATSAPDKIEILIDGYPNELIADMAKDNQNGEEIFIDDFILPIEIAKFFFFDAEKIVSLAEVNSNDQRKQLSKAYSQVLGIQKYEDLKAILEEKLDEYRKKAAQPEDKKALTNIIANISNCLTDRDSANFTLESVQDRQSNLKKESDDLTYRLIRSGDKTSPQELDALQNEKTDFERIISDLQSKLKENLDIIPFAISGALVSQISNQIAIEKSISENRQTSEAISLKIEDIKVDLENAARTELKLKYDTSSQRIREFYEAKIKELILKYFAPADIDLLSSHSILHSFSEIQQNEFQQLIHTIQGGFQEKFERLINEYSSAKSRLESNKRKIHEAEAKAEDPHIAELRKQKDNINRQLQECENDRASISRQLGEIDANLKSLRQQHEALRKKIDGSTTYSAKAEKTRHIIDILNRFISSFKAEKKKSLGDKMLFTLNTLMHKKNFISKIEVDINSTGDDIDIILYDNRGKTINKTSLSMGERQMYASALLHSLVDESEIDFPVFIDSPMQKFDEQHAENIIRNFYPTVSKQVIIFPLINKELTENEYSILRPNISRTYLINNETIDKSTFIETDPAEFISTYKALYNAD